MANSVLHGGLPYPIKNARFTLQVPYLASDGTPTDPTTPDTEISKDGAAFGDCTEEVTTISGSNGVGYITLTATEMDCTMIALAAKVASGPKASLATLYPRNLISLTTGTLSAGSAGGGTLGTVIGYDVTGFFIKTTGGTGGGSANNQVRRIVTYNTSTGAFTVANNWETTPDATTTYSILIPEEQAGLFKYLNDPNHSPQEIMDTLTGGVAVVSLTDPSIIRSAVGMATANLDTQLSTITTATGASAIRTAVGLATANLDTQLANSTAANIRTAIGLGSANLDTQLAQVTPANIRVAVGLTSANLNTQLTTITSQTVNTYIRSAVGLATANLDTQLTALDTAIDGISGGGGGGGLTQADVRTAVGLVSANLDTQISALNTLLTNLGGRIPAALDPNGLMKSTMNAINQSTSAAQKVAKTTDSIVRCTVSASATALSIPTSSCSPAGAGADQFKGRFITFDADTTTPALRGQSTEITASSALSAPIFAVKALTVAPAVGDTFSIT